MAVIRFRVNYRATQPPPDCWEEVVAFVEGVTGEHVAPERMPARGVKEENEAGALVQVEVALDDQDHDRSAARIERDLRDAATAGEVDLLLVESE